MVIIDTGPLVALFDDSEPMHAACGETMKTLKRPPVTTWPVITEAFYLLGAWRKGQAELWDFIMTGGLTIREVPEAAYGRLQELMKKYADNPMDIADATIVVLAETHGIKKIFTLDRTDFSRYRPRHCTHFEIVP
jgi:predicted nucleic acid-binding protein